MRKIPTAVWVAIGLVMVICIFIGALAALEMIYIPTTAVVQP